MSKELGGDGAEDECTCLLKVISALSIFDSVDGVSLCLCIDSSCIHMPSLCMCMYVYVCVAAGEEEDEGEEEEIDGM